MRGLARRLTSLSSLLQVDLRGVHRDVGAGDVAQLVHRQRQRRQRGVGGDHRRTHSRRGRGFGGDGVEQRELIGILHPEVEQAAALDFQHFDIEHHLRLGQVLHRDDLLRQADGGRRIAHHQQVQPLVHIQILGLDQSAQHRHGGLGIGVAQIEALHQQFLVRLLFLRLVGVDQQGVGVDHFFRQLAGHQEHVHRIGDRRVAREQRGFHIQPYVLVENEIDARLPRNHVEHIAQRRIAEFQRDRLAVGRVELARIEFVGAACRLNLLQQGQCPGMSGRLCQDQACGLFRFVGTAGCQCMIRRLQIQLVLAHCGEIGQQRACTRILGVQRQHFLQRGFSRIVAACVQVQLGLGQEMAGQPFALRMVISLELDVVRLLGQLRAQAGNAGFGLARGDQFAPFVEAGAGAAGQAQGEQRGDQNGMAGGQQLNLLCAGCASGPAVDT